MRGRCCSVCVCFSSVAGSGVSFGAASPKPEFNLCCIIVDNDNDDDDVCRPFCSQHQEYDE